MSVSAVMQTATVRGDAKRTTSLITGDAAYPMGGYTLTPNMLGFISLIKEIIRGDAANLASGIYVPVFTPTYVNGVITQIQFQLEQYAVAAEVANGTNVSAASFYLVAEGM
jgi:hypothetical protein